MRYPGGKFAIAAWVISHMPAHQTYVELYGGAASILLLKHRAHGEIYNDLNSDVVNIFRVLRDPLRAAALIELIRLTPYARAEYRIAYEPCKDPIESARRMIFRSWAGIGSDSATRPAAGFRLYRKTTSGTTAAQDWLGFSEHLNDIVQRLRGVVIENLDALTLIERMDRPDTLFYADPPYVRSTRAASSVKYPCEMTDADHRALADRLHSIQGMAMISGYESDLYADLFRDWRCVSRMTIRQNHKPAKECLWLSPNIATTLF